MGRSSSGSEDEAFIAEIQAAPYDDIPRLIYADWLEDRGDSRAEYLRLECEIAALRKADALFIELQPRLAELRTSIDIRWLAAVGRTRVTNCASFALKCPQRWERLKVIGEARTRYCDVCEKVVHYCQSLEELKLLVRRGECVALDSFIKIEQSDVIIDRSQTPLPQSEDVEDMDIGFIVMDE